MFNKHSDRLCLFICECFAFLIHKRRPSGGRARAAEQIKSKGCRFAPRTRSARGFATHRYAATGPPGPGPMTFASRRLAGFAVADSGEGGH